VYFYQFKLTKVCYLALPISEKNEKKRVDGAMNKPATLDKIFHFFFLLANSCNQYRIKVDAADDAAALCSFLK